MPLPSFLAHLRTLAKRKEPPARRQLIFPLEPGSSAEEVAPDDRVYRELEDVLARCRNFPHDLRMFREVEPETRFLDSLTDAAKTSLDIGANVGFYAALLAPSSRRVIAFEANPALQPYLSINTRRHPNVIALPFAVASKAGEAQFEVPFIQGADAVGYFGMGGLQSGDFLRKMGYAGAQIAVPTLPVDALELTDVGFMKVDVEGSELDVLQGAANTIGRCRPAVIVENEHRHNAECMRVFEFLQERDYRGYFVDRATLALMPFERFDLRRNQLDLLDDAGNISDSKRYIYNFMFVPEEDDRLKLI